MLEKTIKSGNFEEVFKKLKHHQTLNLKNNNCLNLYSLSISNNEFNYSSFKDMIMNNIKNYVFSRKKIRDSVINGKEDLLVFEAIKKFREITNNNDSGNGGELGEILLYLFLENELNAYKILSKMELKTNKNDYVKGADGIFLYKHINGDYTNYDFIIGEAKIKNNLTDAISDAFNSIIEHLNEDSIEFELVDTNIFKETFSTEDAEDIKKMIIPNATLDYENKISKNKSFGIFIGYSIDTNLNNLNNTEVIEKINAKLQEDIIIIANNINKKIVKNCLENYSFYVYLLPFNKANEDRANIMSYILK